MGVKNLLPEQFQSSAHSKDRHPSLRGTGNLRREAILTNKLETRGGVFTARQDDGVVVVKRRKVPNRDHVHSFLVNEWIEFIIITRIGVGDEREIDSSFPKDGPMMKGIFLRQRVLDHRNNRNGRHAGPMLEPLHRIAQEGLVAAKFVQHKALDQSLLLRVEALPRAQQMRERAAAINVGNEVHIGLTFERHRHVDDVTRTQIDLRGAARAFDNELLIVMYEAMERFSDNRPQVLLALHPWERADAIVDASHHNHLTEGVGTRFEKNRIHACLWRDSGRERLEILGPPDLLAIRSDGGVVAHVLRFEWRDLNLAIREVAA